MLLYSTNNPAHQVSLKQAVMNSLPPDNGLYMPLEIPRLPAEFIAGLKEYSFAELSFIIANHLIGKVIPEEKLKELVYEAVNFPAPVVTIDDQTSILELFHGPSLAFKDFGARFMARVMSHFNEGEQKELVILVATSGDTGGAVAAGFHHTPGIQVIILYPSGKVSPLQEKQLTTLGGNIEALEVDGTFDDCQKLVKQAFLDHELNNQIRLSSANSINIARLIPQSFYYFEAWKQGYKAGEEISFVIPSGNFGNLTAGVLAKKMGLPIKHLVAATNVNDIIPAYLKSGEYQPKASIATISNAMDVGKPSNFSRLMDLYGSTWNHMKMDVLGYTYSDTETRSAMQEVYERYNYVIDPHGAVGYLAYKEFKKAFPNVKAIVLETAHPSKFIKEVNQTLSIETEIPTRLAALKDREKVATKMSTSYVSFKEYLLDRY